MPRLELFYDVVSPYSYLAYTTLTRYRGLWKLELVMRPAFLGGVMAATGNAPPASLPARGAYLVRDIVRSGGYFDVPLTMPEDFPSKTLPAMRLLALVEREQPARLEALSRALWETHWGEGRAVSAPETLVALARAHDVDEGLVARIGDQEVKDLLKARTDEAVRRGAFGFPAAFVDVDGEDTLFFGSDRLNVLAFTLGLPWHGPRGPGGPG